MNQILESFLTRYGGDTWRKHDINEIRNDLVFELLDYKKTVSNVEILLIDKLIRKIKKQTDVVTLLTLVTEQLLETK